MNTLHVPWMDALILCEVLTWVDCPKYFSFRNIVLFIVEYDDMLYECTPCYGFACHFNLLCFCGCRNRILSLWKKDLSRILPLSECGMPDTPSVHGSPNASLVRDVYTFLDQCVSSYWIAVSFKA